MLKLFILLSLSVTHYTSGPESLNRFEKFIKTYNKSYLTETNYWGRFAIFMENSNYIVNKNSQNITYKLEMNKYGDLTFDEFSILHFGYNGLINRTYENENKNSYAVDYYKPINRTSVDWRAEGLVTDIKDQEQCGSCWAFSAVATMEGAHAKKTGNLTSLSEQDLVDCVPDCDGCDGGWPYLAIDYVINGSTPGPGNMANVSGIDTEVSYQYMGVDETCNFTNSSVGARFTNLTRIDQGDTRGLLNAVLNIGPISVAIDAEEDLQFYSYGIFTSTTCSTTMLDHAVTVVGYGTTSNGTSYYIIKNSWNTDWGQDGYVYFNADIPNMCGIAQDACYAS
jgi:hypothetical protein